MMKDFWSTWRILLDLINMLKRLKRPAKSKSQFLLVGHVFSIVKKLKTLLTKGKHIGFLNHSQIGLFNLYPEKLTPFKIFFIQMENKPGLTICKVEFLVKRVCF
jgi:hypothetical protein